MASEQFKIHDVVSYSVGSSEQYAVVVGIEGDRLVFGESRWSAGWICKLAYRPDTGVMDVLNRNQWTRVWLEQGLYLCTRDGCVFADEDEERCYDRLSSGTLHPESALRLLEKRGNYGCAPQKQEYRMSDAASEHFAKPEVQQWMRERLKERPDARFYKSRAFDGVVAQSWDSDECYLSEGGDARWWPCPASENGDAWVAAKRDGDVYADAQGNPLRPSFERTEVRGVDPAAPDGDCTRMAFWDPGSKRFVILDGVDGGRYEPESPVKLSVASPNCASCGEVLNERYDATVMHDGKRVHGSCAARLERIAAENAPKATAARDPYIAYRQDESLIAAAQASRDAGFVSRFKLDQVSASKAGSFVHPWSAEDVDDI
jgi:hypothetical protein